VARYGALVLVVVLALAVGWGVDQAVVAALAEAATRSGDVVRTPDEVVSAAWRSFGGWALGIGALAAAQWVSSRRTGTIGVASWLVPALAVVTGLGLVLQVGYGDPVHATGWPGERMGDGVALGGILGALLLLVPLDVGDWIERGQAVLVAGIVGTFLALAVVGTGPEGSDARIHLGPIQPLELVKLAFVTFLAGYLGRRASTVRWHRHAVMGGYLRILRPRLLIPALAMLVVLFAGLFWVRDLGPTLVLSIVFLVVLYLVTGSPGWVGIAVGSVAALILTVAWQPDVVGSTRVAVRLRMWLDPWLNGLPNGDQLAASRWAIAAGGLEGMGLGRGAAIPAGHTDLAIAHLAEELGFLGAGLYVLALSAVVVAGWLVAARNRTPERMLAAAGISLLIAAQALVIFAGTTGMLPLTGIVAPFLSSGRTSTTVFVFAVALLVKLGESGEVRADTEALAELRQTLRSAGVPLLLAPPLALLILFFQGVAQGHATTTRGVVTTLADGTVVVRHDPRLEAVARRIRRGELLDRHGHVLVGTAEDGKRTWPLGAALGTLVGPTTAEVLRPPWALERVHDATLRGYPERDDGPSVWMARGADDKERLLFAVRSSEERQADRQRAEKLADGDEVRLLPLPAPELSGLVRFLRAPEAELVAVGDDKASRSVTLTLDGELQKRAVQSLAHWSKKAEAAAAVVIDVDTGQVLARAQVPDYDPGDPAWRAPVWDRDPVFTGVYGPWNDKTGFGGTFQAGSIAKLVTSVAAARTGQLGWDGDGCDIRAETVFSCVERDGQGPYFTREGWTKPIHDHSRDKNHGTVDLVEALAVSCNVYFGQLGLQLGPEPFADLVADGLEVGWSEEFEAGPAGSRTLASTAFGQGSSAMSVSQAARLVSLVGSGGVYRRCPGDLAMSSTCEHETLVDGRALTPVLAGLSAVITRGTGKGLKVPGVRIYGKTGTADSIGLPEEEPYGIEPGGYAAPHSWFVALAEPEGEPGCGVTTPGRLAVAVWIGRGGSGRGAAAPAAIDILKAAHELGYVQPVTPDGVSQVDPLTPAGGIP
jgi:cell division protein FtsW (lipid II flippase)